jgi:hypothetical protein
LLGNDSITKVEKLLLTLRDKKKYVVHYKILQYYIKLGMKVTKVHKTISFKHKAWLKPYIDFCTGRRKEAKTDFEKDFWKLMANAFYGKTLENIRERVNIKLVNVDDTVTQKKMFSKPTFDNIIDFDGDFIGITNTITSIKYNKPIYTGICILDYSKLLMYEFYYDIFNKLIPKNEPLYFDTDSIICNIYTDDLLTEFKKIITHLDMSDYPKDHELYTDKHKKVIGKQKDEMKGKTIHNFYGLRSKAYALGIGKQMMEDGKQMIVDGKQMIEDRIKLKGVGYSAKENIHTKDFYNCLLSEKELSHITYALNSEKHKIFMNEINKKSLGPYDDKRYIYTDGITTAPFE